MITGERKQMIQFSSVQFEEKRQQVQGGIVGGGVHNSAFP